MKKQLRSYAIITLGSVIFALAFDVFFAANRLTDEEYLELSALVGSTYEA